MVSPRHWIAEMGCLDPTPQSGQGWSSPGTADRRAMVSHGTEEPTGMASHWHRRGVVSSRHRRAEGDGIAPTLESGEEWSHPDTAEGWSRPDTSERTGMVSPRHIRADRYGLAPAPQSGGRWDRPDTGERRGMVSPRHRRAEGDGIAPRAERAGLAPAPKGWDRPDTAERRGMVSPWHRRAERDGLTILTNISSSLSHWVGLSHYINLYISFNEQLGGVFSLEILIYLL